MSYSARGMTRVHARYAFFRLRHRHLALSPPVGHHDFCSKLCRLNVNSTVTHALPGWSPGSTADPFSIFLAKEQGKPDHWHLFRAYRQCEDDVMATDEKCWSCGSRSSEAANYCSQCGTRLDRRSASGDALEARSTCERRQLTVMFCDLVESTRLSLELDPEDFTIAVSAYRDVCVRVVRNWKGYVSRYVGDGVLIYFGFPQAAEDDAVRAAAAAWELVRAIAELKLPESATRNGPLPRLRARISLHTGLAVVGDVVGFDSAERHDVLGAAPNIAARLQTLARPGEVVISETTAALLPPTIRLRPIEITTHRPELATVNAFAITEVPQDIIRCRPISLSTFVGRNALREKVASYLGESEKEVAALLLIGEAGVGKSRLVQEVTKHSVSKSIKWIELNCSAYGQMSPLYPFRGWLDEIDTHGNGPASSPEKLDAGNPRARLTSPFERRRRIFGKLQTTIFAHAPRVGLVFEDVHWADSTTLEFVAQLLSAAVPGRFVLLMTSRLPLNNQLSILRRLRVETLDRLLPGHAAQLARELSATRPLNAFELAEIVEHSDGVPLYIEEFVRAITENAAGTQDAGPDHIPITLRDSLMGILDNLGTGRTVALCASVFGRRFDYVHLKELLELDDDKLAPAVGALTKAQIFVQEGEIPNATLEFRHALLRDTAYHTLLKSDRERWHRRVARLAKAGTLPIAESMPELLATHHSLGGSYKEAIDYWLRAQNLAMLRSANVEALGHIRSGLEDCRKLSQEDPSAGARYELELLWKLTAPLIAVSGWSTPELEDVYARARELCRAVGSEDIAFELERGSFNLHLLRSELRTADAVAELLVATARGVGDLEKRDAYLLVALRLKALPAFYGARYTEARSLLHQVLSLYDTTKHARHAFQYGMEPAMLAHSYLAWMDGVDGEASTCRGRVAEALARARGVGHAFSICYALCFGASCAQLLGDIEQAATHAEEAFQVANQHNFEYWLAWARAIQGWVKGLEVPREGIAIIEQARVGYLATGSTLVSPYFEALACSICRSADFDEFGAREKNLRANATETGIWFWEAVLKAGSISGRSEHGNGVQKPHAKRATPGG